MKTLNFSIDYSLVPEMIERCLQIVLNTYDASAHSSILKRWKESSEDWLSEIRLQTRYIGAHGGTDLLCLYSADKARIKAIVSSYFESLPATDRTPPSAPERYLVQLQWQAADDNWITEQCFGPFDSRHDCESWIDANKIDRVNHRYKVDTLSL